MSPRGVDAVGLRIARLAYVMYFSLGTRAHLMCKANYLLGVLAARKNDRSGRVSRHNGIVLFPWSALQRSRLWPDSSVAARQTFEQRQLWPSQIKKHVDRAKRSNEPSTTAQTDRQTDTRHQTPPRSHQQKSLAGFLLVERSAPRILRIGDR